MSNYTECFEPVAVTLGNVQSPALFHRPVLQVLVDLIARLCNAVAILRQQLANNHDMDGLKDLPSTPAFAKLWLYGFDMLDMLLPNASCEC